MKFLNQQNKSIEELFNDFKKRFPDAQLKKPFLTPQTIIVPVSNYKMLLRYKKDHLKFDFMPPVLWTLGGILLGAGIFTIILSIIAGQLVISIGGAIPIIIGVLIVKYIFKNSRKEEFETFEQDVNQVIQNSKENSIFNNLKL